MVETTETATKLHPQQVCFVVDDVPAAAAYCEQRFGWGPFHQFKAPVDSASYGDWQGKKLTEVALGMAGGVQMELLHVHYGRDTTADYQTAYGVGFQHIGITCRSRDAALAQLSAIGGRVNELNEYPGIRFAFVDTPTGPGMFEILQPTEAMEADEGLASSRVSESGRQLLFDVDRTSIVTRDIDKAISFFAGAFAWTAAKATEATLRYGTVETKMRRFVGRAGAMDIELIEPRAIADDPYSQHLLRGGHGLIHAGGSCAEHPQGWVGLGEWLETAEHFALHDWAGGKNSLQTRVPA